MAVNKKYLKIALGMCGGISLFFGGIMLPACLFGSMVEGASRCPGVIFGSICIVVSLFCFIKLFLINRRDQKFNNYAALIGNQKSIPIKWLADKMNCSQERAIKNLRRAMSYGMFSDAYIDEENGLLLFPNYNAHGALKTIYCPNCGAVTEVMIGYYSKCKYCGFVLDSGKPE